MRYFHRQVLEWALSEEALRGRMAFIAGPRQIGKTTAVERFLSSRGQRQLYYNWDTSTVRRRYAANPLFFVEDLPPEIPRPWVVLDEIHKYPKWKNLLKGYYDEWRRKIQFIVTGSARLDLFRRSGDSLVGRYFLYRMLPLGIREVAASSQFPAEWSPEKELESIPSAAPGAGAAVEKLVDLTGFPEPFAVGTRQFYNRWRENYISLVLQEDLRDLTKITQIQKLETLLYLLPERVGAPLSLNALRRPLETAYGSVRTWLDALEMVYLVFSVPPWTLRLSRSVLKERKHYFWDWAMAADPGKRFENFIAVQLQRAVAGWNEKGQGPFQLFYLRTKDGLEVDFAVADRGGVRLLVEAKESDVTLSKNLPFFRERTGAKVAVQVVRRKGFCLQKGKGLYVMGADRLLSLLP